MSPVPTLPSEIVAYILDLAVPSSPTFGTNSERTTVLKSVALLSHAWLPYARSRLYHTVLLQPAPNFMEEPDRSAQRLVASLRARPELALLVRVIRFRKSRGKRGPRKVLAGKLEVKELLHLCRELEELSLVELDGVELAWLGQSSSPRMFFLLCIICSYWLTI